VSKNKTWLEYIWGQWPQCPLHWPFFHFSILSKPFLGQLAMVPSSLLNLNFLTPKKWEKAQFLQFWYKKPPI
jgi:hypothetical protein